MTQHYVDPRVIRDPWVGTPRPSRRLFGILERDGQIVPLLVDEENGTFTIALDTFQRERLAALRALEWPTVLVETEWTDDDL